MHRRSVKLYIVIYVISLLLFSCGIKNPVDDSAHPFSHNVRIVPGIGIAGVKLGDAKEVISEMLGQPDMGGPACGLHRSWMFSEYKEGIYAGLSVYFLEDEPGQVDGVSVIEPYQGKTYKGIGIGSTMEEVHSAYGLPKKKYPNINDELYLINNKDFRITYQENKVSAIFIGWFIPMPES